MGRARTTVGGWEGVSGAFSSIFLVDGVLSYQ
jgi:hypothetical protein